MARMVSLCQTLPCPDCTAEGITWARVYSIGAYSKSAAPKNYFCPTCKTVFALEELLTPAEVA